MNAERPRPSRVSRIQRRLAKVCSGDSTAPPPLLDGVSEALSTLAEVLEDRRSLRPSGAVESWLDVFLNELYELLRGRLRFDRMALALVTDANQVVTARWARASYSPISLGRGYQEALADTTLERLLLTGTSRIIPDLEVYLRDRPSSPSTRRLVKEGLRSNLTCPLTRPGRADGFLFFSSRQAGHFRQEHARLLDALRPQLCELTVRMNHYDEAEAGRKAARSWAFAALPRDFAERALRGERQSGRTDTSAIVVRARLHGSESFHVRFSASELVERLDLWQRIFQRAMCEAGLEPVLCDARDTLALRFSTADQDDSPQGAVTAASSVIRKVKEQLPELEVSMAVTRGLVVSAPVGQLRKGLVVLGPAVDQSRFLVEQAAAGQLLLDFALMARLQAEGVTVKTRWVEGRRASDYSSGSVPRFGVLTVD